MSATPRWVSLWFRAAAVYGLLVLLPQYFVAPPVDAEVNFYGFIGTASAFQLVFWVIGGAPAHYRTLMLASVIEKLVFAVPVIALFVQGRVPATILAFGLIDLLLGIGFALAWRATRPS